MLAAFGLDILDIPIDLSPTVRPFIAEHRKGNTAPAVLRALDARTKISDASKVTREEAIRRLLALASVRK